MHKSANLYTVQSIYKATPNKLDAHPTSEKKNWDRWEVFIFLFFFIILTALKNRMVLKETFNTFKLNCQIE